MRLNILIIISIVFILIAAIISLFSLKIANEKILYFSKTIQNKSPSMEWVELEPNYPVVQYLKDTYVWFDIFFDMTLFPLCIGVMGFVLYISILAKRKLMMRKKN